MLFSRSLFVCGLFACAVRGSDATAIRNLRSSAVDEANGVSSVVHHQASRQLDDAPTESPYLHFLHGNGADHPSGRRVLSTFEQTRPTSTVANDGDRQLTSYAVQGQVTSLKLINANTDKAISDLEDGMVIALDAIPNMNGTTVALNVEALVNGTDVGSVRFGLNGNKYFKTESNAPFAMCGNSGPNYHSCGSRLGLGKHTIVATPRNRNGQTGRPVTMTITIVETDVTKPKLISLKALTPTTVDVSNGDAYVTMEITLQDDASSIFGGVIQYGNSSAIDENYVFNFGGPFSTPIFPPPTASIGTANNDPVTYIVRMRVRKFEKPGLMPISMAFDDKMANFVPLEADQLAALGFPSVITVVNSGVVDTAPIQLLNFTALSPLVINATAAPTNVTFEIVIQDDVSGFDFGYVADTDFALVYSDFSKNNSFFWETFNHVDPALPAGVPHTFRLNVALRAGALKKPGSYFLQMALTDGVRNTILFNSTQLAARGFPSVVKIVNGTI